MKKEWSKPYLEILDVKMTMKGWGSGGNGGDSGDSSSNHESSNESGNWGIDS